MFPVKLMCLNYESSVFLINVHIRTLWIEAATEGLQCDSFVSTYYIQFHIFAFSLRQFPLFAACLYLQMFNMKILNFLDGNLIRNDLYTHSAFCLERYYIVLLIMNLHNIIKNDSILPGTCVILSRSYWFNVPVFICFSDE